LCRFVLVAKTIDIGPTLEMSFKRVVDSGLFEVANDGLVDALA
jgi:hypothetical protein